MTQGDPSEGFSVPWEIVRQIVVLIAIGVGCWFGADQLAGVLRVLLAIVAVVALGYALYLLGMLAFMVGLFRLLQRMSGPSPETGLDTLPWYSWLIVVIVPASWVLTAAASGFDKDEWWGSGAGAFLIVGALVAPTFRSRRKRVAAGPGGPRHR